MTVQLLNFYVSRIPNLTFLSTTEQKPLARHCIWSESIFIIFAKITRKRKVGKKARNNDRTLLTFIIETHTRTQQLTCRLWQKRNGIFLTASLYKRIKQYIIIVIFISINFGSEFQCWRWFLSKHFRMSVPRVISWHQ